MSKNLKGELWELEERSTPSESKKSTTVSLYACFLRCLLIASPDLVVNISWNIWLIHRGILRENFGLTLDHHSTLFNRPSSLGIYSNIAFAELDLMCDWSWIRHIALWYVEWGWDNGKGCRLSLDRPLLSEALFLFFQHVNIDPWCVKSRVNETCYPCPQHKKRPEHLKIEISRRSSHWYYKIIQVADTHTFGKL